VQQICMLDTPKLIHFSWKRLFSFSLSFLEVNHLCLDWTTLSYLCQHWDGTKQR